MREEEPEPGESWPVGGGGGGGGLGRGPLASRSAWQWWGAAARASPPLDLWLHSSWHLYFTLPSSSWCCCLVMPGGATSLPPSSGSPGHVSQGPGLSGKKRGALGMAGAPPIPDRMVLGAGRECGALPGAESYLPLSSLWVTWVTVTLPGAPANGWHLL